MYLISLQTIVLATLVLQKGLTVSAAEEQKQQQPCTIRVQKSGYFFDLRPLSLLPQDADKHTEDERAERLRNINGYDYPANFTMNICAPVLEAMKDVEGVKESLWANVSAYYEHSGKKYSIGSESSTLVSRGQRLVLQYTDGSPCSPHDNKRALHHDDASLEPIEPRKDEGIRRKSTTISFHCETDPVMSRPQISYVGTDPDECAYFFEIRSHAACPGAEPAQQGLGPGGVFGVIVVIAILVYFIGGIMYQRSVAHARGWRQLPNYSMWASIGSFFQDIFIIATSSCARFLPSKRGYSSLSFSADGDRARGRRQPEDENRLIDQLDEEWDD